MQFLTDEKLVIVGAAGMIGSNMAQSALMMGLTSNLCLYDVFSPEGVAEEMRQSGFDEVNITATTDVAEAFKDAKYIISSGGAPRKEGMTREDLLKGNCQIAAEFGDNIKKYCPDVKHVVVIFNPADDLEARLCVKAAIEHDGPVYMRFGRLAVEDVNGEDYAFEPGKGVQLRDGKDVTIIATGLMVQEALKAAETLKEDGIDARVINIHTIKPIDEEIIIKAAKETGAIVTAEEHYVMGGLGSAVCEVVCSKAPVPVKIIGTDRFGKSGKPAELFEEYGLTAENIVKNVKEVMKLK